MDEVHIHLLTNHLPIIGGFIGLIIFVYGWFSRNIILKQTGLVVFIVAALGGILTFLTGEGAEDAVEDIAVVTRDAIHLHEDAAEMAFYMMQAAAAAALLLLIQYRRAVTNYRWLEYVCLLLMILSAIAMMRTGYLGGLIRHTELVGSN